jgi:SulP family sulfate permease
MIGQSTINVRSGGRGRLSTFVAGLGLLILVVLLGDTVGRIPMPALVAVMIMVSISTFNWGSIINLRTYPRSSSVVMLATVAVVLYTHNLAYGVLVGVLLSGVFFAAKISQIMEVRSVLSENGRERTYIVTGQVFFASSERFVAAFDMREALDQVRIDVTHAHLWDVTAIAALDKVVMKFREAGAQVDVIGLNEASQTMVDNLAVHDKGAMDLVPAH